MHSLFLGFESFVDGSCINAILAELGLSGAYPGFSNGRGFRNSDFLAYGERVSASLFWGSGGLAPSGVQGQRGLCPPEANEILTNEIHILY